MHAKAKANKHRWRYARNLLLVFASVLLIALIGVSALLGVRHGNSLIHPPRIVPCCDTPATYNLSYSDVSFQADDGITLRGWYIPSQNGAVIIVAHGLGGSRTGMLPLANVLAKHGYGILVYDLRAHGASDGTIFGYGWRDVLAASNYLRKVVGIDSKRIGMYGSSLGGVMAVQAAARDTNIAALAADGIGATTLDDFPPRTSLLDWLFIPYDVASIATIQLSTGESLMSMHEAARHIAPRPILLITSAETDGALKTEHDITLSVYDAAAQPKSFWEIPGVGHTGGFGAFPQEYEARLVTFFDSALFK